MFKCLNENMHIYIYDSYVNQKKYDKTLARIETRMTDLGLNGKISRLGLMKNIPDLVDNELRRGAKTMIAVGNDNTVNQVINSLANSHVPLGIIPIGEENNLIAASLGIGTEEEACDVLSARRIVNLDLGKANSQYFLTNASINNKGTIVEIDKNYSIETMEQGRVNIINLDTGNMDLPKNAKFDPQDGVLELFVSTKQSKNFLKKITDQSIFPFEKLTIINKSLPVVLDNSVKITAPVEISVAEQMLSVIVGKERGF